MPSTCAFCHGTLPALAAGARVGRRDTCPHCQRDLHACVQCANWDASGRLCREPAAQTEQPRDRELANFCDWYRPSDRPGAGRAGDAAARARAAADALFKKH
jgi:hypothetical protein